MVKHFFFGGPIICGFSLFASGREVLEPNPGDKRVMSALPSKIWQPILKMKTARPPKRR
jgi:hypothetical protein